MIRTKSAVVIKCSCATAFAIAQDYDRRLDWDPFLRAIKQLPPYGPTGPGSQFWVKATNFLQMQVQYITYKEPEVVAMQMTNGPYFFKTFTGTWRFQAKGEHTLVSFIYAFKLRRTLGFAEKLVGWHLRRTMKRRLVSLKEYIESAQA